MNRLARKRKARKKYNPMKDTVRNSVHYSVGKPGTMEEGKLHLVCVNFKKDKFWDKSESEEK